VSYTELDYEKARVEIAKWLNELNELGSADAIADKLLKDGYEGNQGEPTSCPIARFLDDKISGMEEIADMKVSVNGPDVKIVGDGSVPSPRHVGDFVSNFDDGDFPDLVLGGLDEDEDEEDDPDDDLDDYDLDDDEDGVDLAPEYEDES
jgi:hypothetical protein